MPSDLAQENVRGSLAEPVGPSPPRRNAGTPPSPHAAAPRRAFFGSIAVALVNSGRLPLQMVVLPIMARLLGPSAFGLIALAMPFILFATVLSDAGMGAALVRRAQPSRAMESTVFWLSVTFGVLSAASVCLVAPAAAQVLHQPRLTPVLLAMSPILILSSCLSVANSRISRSRHFALFAVGDLLSLVLSSAAAILAALEGLGPWSLVIQQLVLWIAKAAWLLPASRFLPAFIFRPSLIGDLLAFGLNNVGANIADLLGKTVPALIIGGELGVLAAGHYAVAYQLVRVPDLVLSSTLFLATFTAVASLVAKDAPAAQLALRTLRMVASVLAPLFIGLALVSDLVIGLFLGSKWQAAAPVLALMAPAGFLLSLYAVVGAVLMGLGRADLQFRLTLVCGFAMLLGVAVGARFSLQAATLGVTLGAAAAAPFYAVTLSRQLGESWTRLVTNMGWPLIASAVMAAAVLVVRHEASGGSRSLQLAACVLVGGGVFAAVLSATSWRQILEDLRHILPAKAQAETELS